MLNKHKPLHSEKGIATVESALLLTIFVVFMTYCIGFFGVVHTGILNSISARAYAFEIFRNRTNLTYLRDSSASGNETEHYARLGFRVHGVISEKSNPSAGGDGQWFVTDRRIAQGRESPAVSGRPAPSSEQLDQIQRRESSGVNPVWIKTTYGICLNQTCGDNT